ncbi:DNA-binding transcriptional regulator, GntR family [Paramicrobacterium humi]|uniref:DNA-binding transcriptional regulator, GntR family n=1 Tax=Paramicrobacterium humi TaxID=640635 RepID=A0A1H4KX59_9MICO|nr:GntR family transcriptional regulator [Microbacterium humi]SEB62685.1 DNA-binding transcriptional regulator, GntR family [Microbacterium humi]
MALDAQFSSLGAIERLTRRELILDRLRSAVTTGELAQGTHLAETELSASLGVSRGTLREALRALEEEGLLTKDARGRLSVRIVTPAEVRDIFDVRFALESLACESVCARDDLDHVVVTLRGALQRLEESERGPIADQVAADLAFHEAICRASDNHILVESWRRVSGLARASITAAGRDTAIANMAASRHAPILDAIASGDASKAREVLREHNNAACTAITTQLEALEAHA